MTGVKPISWQLPIRLQSGRQERVVWLGLDQKANRGIDCLDRFIPPISPTESSLEVHLVNGQYRLRRDVRAISEGQAGWQIELSSSEPVRLKIENQQMLVGQELVITDGQIETILTAEMEMELANSNRQLTVSL